MQEKFVEKECARHGVCKFVLETRGYYRCTKCRSYQVSKRRDVVKQKAVEYKGGKCELCSYNKCIAALDFHHTDPEHKDFAISKDGHTRSWESIKAEIDKCMLVCANCHREIHDGGRLQAKKEQYEKDRLQKQWKHGTPSGYTYHKCRCVLCTAANAERHRRYNAKRKNMGS